MALTMLFLCKYASKVRKEYKFIEIFSLQSLTETFSNYLLYFKCQNIEILQVLHIIFLFQFNEFLKIIFHFHFISFPKGRMSYI